MNIDHNDPDFTATVSDAGTVYVEMNLDRNARLAADARALLFNGCDTPMPNLSQLWRIDAILREIAGIPPREDTP